MDIASYSKAIGNVPDSPILKENSQRPRVDRATTTPVVQRHVLHGSLRPLQHPPLIGAAQPM